MGEKWRKQGEVLFYKEYPNGDPSKFVFGYDVTGTRLTSIDIYFSYKLKYKDYVLISDHNKHEDRFKVYLYGGSFPRIFLANGTIQPLPKGRKLWEQWPPKKILNYPIHNFRVYVNDKDYFMSQLPIVKINTSRSKSSWDDNEIYYRMLLFTYIATYGCGISMQHLDDQPRNVPGSKIITSLMRFHIYYTIQRLLKRADNGEHVRAISNMYNGGALYGKTNLVHLTHYYQNKRLSDGTLGEVIVRNIGDVANDYKRYVPEKSDGLTTVGIRLLNDSIAGYVYSVLGAQAKIRASIVNQGAISLQCQDVFRKLVGEGIVSNDVVVGVSNMRKAVNDCNQVLNLAVSPDVFLLPSDMTILKERIPGYSNVLYRASEKSMKFGINKELNYERPKRERISQKKTITKVARAYPVRSVHPDVNPIKSPKQVAVQREPKQATHPTDLMTILLLSAATTFTVVRYVL